jgi:anti-anti-sigma factor
MECQISSADDIAEVVLIGSLDSSWSPYLAERLDEVIRTGVREVRVDLLGVTYLSSNGIALLVQYNRQMRRIGGVFRIVADSDAVGHVLRLTGVDKLLRTELPVAGAQSASSVALERDGVTIEEEGVTLQVFKKPTAAAVASLELIGDPTKLASGGYSASDDRTWRAAPSGVALGLGALGPNFEACRDRYGEFLAAAGVAAYRPSVQPGRPDFERAAGAFVPEVRVLYGLAFSMGVAPTLVRFEAKGEPLNRSVSLSRLVEACLTQSETLTVGLVLVGETDGLVGAALRRSPTAMSEAADLFAHPDARDWLSMTAEPEYARSTALVVGVATLAASPALAPFVRPLSGAGSANLRGHFHAAVVAFRPLPRGTFEMVKTVQNLFEPGRVEGVLHLLGDCRPILGAGESTFTRGAIWVVSLTEGGAPA